MLTQKNAKATAVLAALCSKAGDGFRHWLVEPYLNGREEGFAVTNFDCNRKVAFSENRNSDDIVLYTGTPANFSMQGNTPSEATYAARKYFGGNDYDKAASEVWNYLRD